MDFFEHQEQARRKTSLLVVYFLGAVVAIIVSVYLAVAAVLFYGQNGDHQGTGTTLWFPDVFAAVSLGTLALIGGGSMYKFAELSGGGETVARSLGGRRVAPNTTDLGERVLLNVVEEMAIASGTPVPPVFILDHEGAINAFAAGTTPQNAVIGVTRGTIDTLKRDELQGVIAHEFSHILNGDMRLNLRLIGVLNGILLISMVGFILLRSTSARSSGSSDGKRGSNPLPLLGLLLYIIGFVGVFFGQLIKSAVSRQREFLADSSAVQFTRYPDGIAGALKKIGGFMAGSRLQTAKAAEASHMYFGNGMASAWFQLLATHPPLVERIRRIDPNFDGKFPPVTPTTYSQQDLVDPRSLAERRAQAGATGAASPQVQGFAFAPAAAVESVGAPLSAHLGYATELVASLPAEIRFQVRDPLGAVATIYALLLDDDEPAVRQKQLAYLAAKADPTANAETLHVAPYVSQLDDRARLPLVDMAVPVLQALSARQLAAFRDDVTFLIKADNRVSLFEYAVQRLVFKRLLPRLELKPASAVKYTTLDPLLSALSGLLSTLAHAGTRDASEAARAFQLGIEQLPEAGARVKLLPRDQCGLPVLDAALDQLAGSSPSIKKRVIEACAASIAADGQVTVQEGELLRVIADSLECPMPPLLELKSA
jgi:Zn-dependent protease with chaperone function